MPAVAATVQADMFEAFGIESWDHATPGLSTFCLNQFNAVLQHIYSLLPDTFWRESDPRSLSILAPRTISVSVTAGSKAITFSSPSYDSTTMEGCTLIISGDAAQNRLVHDVNASPTLWKAYAGNSGTVSATLYHDAHTLADAEEILPPVLLDGNFELIPMRTERHRLIMDSAVANTPANRIGFPTPWLFPQTSLQRSIQTPSSYLVAPAPHYQGGISLRLLMSSLPDRAYTMTYRVKGTVPARVTAWTDARTWLVPHDYTESILLPMIRHRLMDHPNFNIAPNLLQPKFEAATKILANLRPRGWQPAQIGVGGDW